jgi:7,8-dihydropterin-6-yl-methyl-4-(beta-D-ribofuranosyl)aminobenzene 5'-phosphate synthase
MITITVLVENMARGDGVLGEHGLSLWVDTGRHRVLFDTGQGMALIPNAERLGIDLSTADAVVLSHGHMDHVGGLESVWPLTRRAELHIHPRTTERKYSGSTGRARCSSVPYVEQRRFALPERAIRVTTERHEVVPGVFSTGEIPRVTDFEDTGGPLFLDDSLQQPDLVLDEQSLYLPTSEGVLILTGCAHAGVINTMIHVSRWTDSAPVRFILGGWHLENASTLRMAETIRHLRVHGVRQLGFCHCTGAAPGRRLWSEFPDLCAPVHVGAKFQFNP